MTTVNGSLLYGTSFAGSAQPTPFRWRVGRDTLRAGVQDETTWLTLAMSRTLAGNLTLVSSMANLLVLEGVTRHGVAIGFWQYGRIGIPVALLTFAFGVLSLGVWSRGWLGHGR